jgi:hypothetical protein
MMFNKLERVWKEVIVYYREICLDNFDAILCEIDKILQVVTNLLIVCSTQRVSYVRATIHLSDRKTRKPLSPVVGIVSMQHFKMYLCMQYNANRQFSIRCWEVKFGVWGRKQRECSDISAISVVRELLFS